MMHGKLITAEEFLRMPDPEDGTQQELVRGVIMSTPLPGGLHGFCCSSIGWRLGKFIEEKCLGILTLNNAGFVSERDPDTVRGPDVAFWSHERLPVIPKGYASVPPDLEIEVVSPSDTFARILAKINHYLTHGVRIVWVADPEDRSVTVHRSLGSSLILDENATVSGEDVLPGFQCKVADLLG